MLDAALGIFPKVAEPGSHIVVPGMGEEQGVDAGEVVLRIHRIAHIEIGKLGVQRLPLSGSRLQLLERIDAVGRQGRLGQRGGYLLGERVLAMAGVEGEIHLAAEIGLVGYTALEGVAEVFVGSGGIVLVEVGADDVDIG